MTAPRRSRHLIVVCSLLGLISTTNIGCGRSGAAPEYGGGEAPSPQPNFDSVVTAARARAESVAADSARRAAEARFISDSVRLALIDSVRRALVDSIEWVLEHRIPLTGRAQPPMVGAHLPAIDSAVTASDTSTAAETAVDVEVDRLTPGQVRYTGPDTMVVGSTVSVSVELFKRVPVAKPPPVPGKQIFTAETSIGDSAEVCLVSNPADFTISGPDGACSKQAVGTGVDNLWSWLVTPLKPGMRTLRIRVSALLASMPPHTVYDSSYTVVVRVAPRSLVSRAAGFLKTGWGLVVSIAGGLTVIGTAILTARRVKRRSQKPHHGKKR
jgi:hypothetical protein